MNIVLKGYRKWEIVYNKISKNCLKLEYQLQSLENFRTKQPVLRFQYIESKKECLLQPALIKRPIEDILVDNSSSGYMILL
jgi:hypothetical protein